MRPKYWQTETPVVLENKRNRIEWYPQAGKLQVQRAGSDGTGAPGRIVTLDVSFARRDPESAAQMASILKDVIKSLE